MTVHKIDGKYGRWVTTLCGKMSNNPDHVSIGWLKVTCKKCRENNPNFKSDTEPDKA